MKSQPDRPRFGAVSFLNSVPLVWGMTQGPQQDQVDLSFSIPAVCADQFESGELEVGLLPVAEIIRQGLQVVPGVGICCHDAVRSILLFSKVSWPHIRTLSVDSSSRTSVELARVILRERFGATPRLKKSSPDLRNMMVDSDAALIIGDPALYIDPESEPYDYLDLGAEWVRLTGLPMVFATWACRPGADVERYSSLAVESYEYGKQNLAAIIEQESANRNLPLELTSRYLQQHIRYELLGAETDGLARFVQLAGLSQLQSV